jgi:hypothetical protein
MVIDVWSGVQFLAAGGWTDHQRLVLEAVERGGELFI